MGFSHKRQPNDVECPVRGNPSDDEYLWAFGILFGCTVVETTTSEFAASAVMARRIGAGPLLVPSELALGILRIFFSGVMLKPCRYFATWQNLHGTLS